MGTERLDSWEKLPNNEANKDPKNAANKLEGKLETTENLVNPTLSDMQNTLWKFWITVTDEKGKYNEMVKKWKAEPFNWEVWWIGKIGWYKIYIDGERFDFQDFWIPLENDNMQIKKLPDWSINIISKRSTGEINYRIDIKKINFDSKKLESKFISMSWGKELLTMAEKEWLKEKFIEFLGTELNYDWLSKLNTGMVRWINFEIWKTNFSIWFISYNNNTVNFSSRKDPVNNFQRIPFENFQDFFKKLQKDNFN